MPPQLSGSTQTLKVGSAPTSRVSPRKDKSVSASSLGSFVEIVRLPAEIEADRAQGPADRDTLYKRLFKHLVEQTCS